MSLLTTVPCAEEFLSKRATIDESSDTTMPASEAVNTLEKEVGWDAETSDFKNPVPLKELAIGIGGKLLPSDYPRSKMIEMFLKGQTLPDVVDIVVPSIRDLDFLEIWKPFIEPFHIIIIQDGNPDKILKIPKWADYELYNRNDIKRALGDRAWVISEKDASIRNFGFLVSDKRYVYTLDDDCLPAEVHGKLVNAIEEHMFNMLTPSTPSFFNTVYDPFRPGVDFVRGYPYSRRNGVPTVVSHGLWMNAYDYDAPTQLLKVSERNTRYHDMTLTIPYKVLYPMCSMNVAFDKQLIGAAFMQGLMGEGQPWARYDDMFCGWASKVVADHLRLGTKSGAPYIRHNKASNPFTNLKKEYMGLKWQEIAIEFFESVQIVGTTAQSAYLDLADKLEVALSSVHPYFKRLAKAMRIWVDIWDERFGGIRGDRNCVDMLKVDNVSQPVCIPKLLPTASRSSIKPSSESTCAVFTVVFNERHFLPIWIRYYSKHVPVSDLWILDHNSNDGSTNPGNVTAGIHVKTLNGEKAHMPHAFLNRQVELHQQRLFRAGYKCVLFTEVDEFVVPNPTKYPQGLKQYFNQFIDDTSRQFVVLSGYEVAHVSKGNQTAREHRIDWTKNILSQRNYFTSSEKFSKPLLSKIPLRFGAGFHYAVYRSSVDVSLKSGNIGKEHIDPDFLLFHTHGFDKDYCYDREKRKFLNAKSRGLVSEKKFGINLKAFRHANFEYAFLAVCTNALASFDSTLNVAKDGKGNVLMEIPKQYKNVVI